jgi:hypothetical protein
VSSILYLRGDKQKMPPEPLFAGDSGPSSAKYICVSHSGDPPMDEKLSSAYSSKGSRLGRCCYDVEDLTCRGEVA